MTPHARAIELTKAQIKSAQTILVDTPALKLRSTEHTSTCILQIATILAVNEAQVIRSEQIGKRPPAPGGA